MEGQDWFIKYRAGLLSLQLETARTPASGIESGKWVITRLPELARSLEVFTLTGDALTGARRTYFQMDPVLWAHDFSDTVRGFVSASLAEATSGYQEFGEALTFMMTVWDWVRNGEEPLAAYLAVVTPERRVRQSARRRTRSPRREPLTLRLADRGPSGLHLPEWE